MAATTVFSHAEKIIGYEINSDYLALLRARLKEAPGHERVRLEQADFFTTNWQEEIGKTHGPLLVLGNFPWVTNAGLGVIGGSNLPEKSNFLRHNGFDAISGKANFDISEWMLLEVLRWFQSRDGDVAMLVKTAVARKVLAHAERQKAFVRDAILIKIDARKEFGAAVDACLLLIRFSKGTAQFNHDYVVFESLADKHGRRVAHRDGLIVSDINKYETYSFLVGESPQKWRSGVKHDASEVMEFTLNDGKLENGLGETVQLEPTYLYPLFKGSDIGANKDWRKKYTLVTQRFVGAPTEPIRQVAPRTWDYLNRHSAILDDRASTIYDKNPRFSIFGVGDYTFRPWKIAICGLYKYLRFRLIGPIEERPAVFDDTVYYLSFDSEVEAREILIRLRSPGATDLLSSLIFWDEKRPIKTRILNVFDWSRLDNRESIQQSIL